MKRVAWILLLAACSSPRWYKGNTHTHTLWSDGDAPPEVAVAWYRDHGYDFLALSDHNIMLDGEKWVEVGGERVRLLTLAELRARFDRPLLIAAEEITDAFEKKPVHVNGVNLVELVEPRHGASVHETMQNNIDAVVEQSRRTGVPMLAHLNHPNFGWGITAEDLMRVEGDRFFEVFNGHPAVHNRGDDAHPGTDRMWDVVNSIRAVEGRPLLYGVATDDTHHYHEQAPRRANAGRGWIRVRAPRLDADSIVRAMQRGDFYATTGVSLADVRVSRDAYVVEHDGGRVEFIGTRRGFDATSTPTGDPSAHVSRAYSDEIGVVLHATTDNPAVYRFRGDELYVRARITRDGKTAWTQPKEVNR